MNNDYISPVQRGKIPSFVRTDYPDFEKYMMKYFQWLEEDGQLVSVLTNWQSGNDADNQIDPYVDAILRDLGWNWEGSLDIPKKVLISVLKDFYLSRGTFKSFEFLFNVLFGKTVKITYPREKLLIPSSAEYVNECSMFTTSTSERTDSFRIIKEELKAGGYVFVQGLVSGTVTGIEQIETILSGNNSYYQIYITEPLVSFIPREGIKIVSESSFVVETNINVGQVVVGTPGFGGAIDDVVQVNGANINGYISVTSLIEGSISGISITAAGSSYTVGDRIIAEQNADSKGFGFFARVSAVNGSGSITQISLDNKGNGYVTLPRLKVLSKTGFNAIITPASATIGGLRRFDYVQPFADFDLLTVTAVYKNSTLTVSEKATFSRKKYISRLGVLGENSTLIDSFRFQQFSYDVISPVSFEKSTQAIDSLLHPYGYVRSSVFELADGSLLDINLVGSSTLTTSPSIPFIFTLQGDYLITLEEDELRAI